MYQFKYMVKYIKVEFPFNLCSLPLWCLEMIPTFARCFDPIYSIRYWMISGQLHTSLHLGSPSWNPGNLCTVKSIFIDRKKYVLHSNIHVHCTSYSYSPNLILFVKKDCNLNYFYWPISCLFSDLKRDHELKSVIKYLKYDYRLKYVMRSSQLRQPRQTLPPPDAGGFITLDQIRPHPRVQNDYIDSPPRPKPPGNLKTISSGGSGIVSTLRENQNNRTRGLRSLNTHIISAPPLTNVSPPLKKDPVIKEDDSIICKKCHKCRCGACTDPQELPSKWLCGNTCHVSGQCCIETASCYCCVQAVFYHCGGKDEQDADYDCLADPCACCSQPNCVKRWTCMALMALCLPCLCCYWPMKGCLKCCTMCYNKCRKKGCRCAKNSKPKKIENGSQSPRRLLLIESDSSSAW